MSLLDDLSNPTARLRVLGQIISREGTKNVDISINSSNAAYKNDVRELTSGDNVISVPTNAKVCVITPPKSNTVALKHKWNSGEAGGYIHLDSPWVLSIDSVNQTSFIINAASTMTSPTSFQFA